MTKEIFSRNIGILTPSEQNILQGSTVAISGAGGVGGLLAERLVRLGIGRLKIIDPGNFEPSNLNRQFGSSTLSLEKKKAEVVFTIIKDINPEADISFANIGIGSQQDADKLVRGCDVIADGMDFGLFRQSVFLQRAARQLGIYYMFASAIGFGALVTIFDPDGLTLEEYDKIPPDFDFEQDEDPVVPLDRICPVMPSYTMESSAEADLIMQQIITGEKTAPTTSIGVGLASIMAANEVMNILLKKREIRCAPVYNYVDLLDQRFVVGTVV